MNSVLILWSLAYPYLVSYSLTMIHDLVLEKTLILNVSSCSLNRIGLNLKHFCGVLKDDKKAATACFERAGLNPELFFVPGVLGTLEEIRDDRIMKLVSWLQAWIRGWASRKYYSKMQKQRTALIVMQRNIRKFKIMRSWLWYELWIKLKPRLKATRGEEELEKLEATAVKAEEEFEKVLKVREELEAQNALLLAEKNELLAAVESSKGGMSEYLDKQAKLLAQKAELEGQLNETLERLRKEEDARNQIANGKKKCEKNAKGEELISKVNKEKKHLQECNQKTAEDLQGIEDKCNNLNKVKTKLESSLDELEDTLEREKKLRAEVEKSKRKVEGT
nr:myosin heavy chain, muscle-like [Penaeus vannamei]